MLRLRHPVPFNNNIDHAGGIVTWIDNLAGERAFGNDLDPTLNLDILEVSFCNCARWRLVATPARAAGTGRFKAFE